MTEPRPKIDADMILEAAEVVATKVDGDPEAIAKHYRYPMDGFELAKALDRYEMWDTTRDDMEELDAMDMLVAEALRNAEKQWFDRTQPQPPFEIGTRIKWRGEVGEIVDIYAHGPAKYLMKPDASTIGNGLYIVNFEDAQLFEEAA